MAETVYQVEFQCPEAPPASFKSQTGADGTHLRWEDGGSSLQIHGGGAEEEGMFVRLQSWAEPGPGVERGAYGAHPDLAKLLGKRVRVTVEVLDQ